MAIRNQIAYKALVKPEDLSVRGEEMDIGMYGHKIKPRLSTRIKASDQLHQMEGVYITRMEAKTASIVELVIITDPDLAKELLLD